MLRSQARLVPWGRLKPHGPERLKLIRGPNRCCESEVVWIVRVFPEEPKMPEGDPDRKLAPGYPTAGIRLAAALLAVVCLAGRGTAQAPPCPSGGCPPSPSLPPVPSKAPRPPAGPEAVSSFLDGLTCNDAALEILVGQGRVLNLKEDITAGGKGQP